MKNRWAYKLQVYFMLFLILSIPVLSANPGFQSGITINVPERYETPPSTYVVPEGESELTFEMCTLYEGVCEENCDSLEIYADLIKLSRADVGQAYTEQELGGFIPDNPNVMEYRSTDYEEGYTCFQFTVSEEAYYLVAMGAFGSPAREGISNSASVGFVRVRKEENLFCDYDGQFGQSHEFLCKDDGTYQKCAYEYDRYDDLNLCSSECGAIASCDGLSPNPDCVSSCKSDEAEMTISDDVINVIVTLPSEDEVELTIEDLSNDEDGEKILIDNVEINSEETSNLENEPFLVEEIGAYGYQYSDIEPSKEVDEEHPAADMVPKLISIEDFVIGTGDEGQAYMLFDEISYEVTFNGTDKTDSGVLFVYMIDDKGERNQVDMLELTLESDRVTVIEDAFYPFVVEGEYKVLLEFYQDKEKIAYRYWVGERPDEGVLKIIYDPSKLSESIMVGLDELPSNEELEELFNDWLIALKEQGHDESVDEFTDFMEEYLKLLYPNEEEYTAIQELFTKKSMEQIMDELLEDYKNDRYAHFYFDQAIPSTEYIRVTYDMRADTLENKLLGTDKNFFQQLFDPISLVSNTVAKISGENERRAELLREKSKIIENMGGVFTLSKGRINYLEEYPVIVSEETSEEDIQEIFGLTKESDEDELDTKLKVFREYVMTKDLMKDIHDDNAAGAIYGYGWMLFYSAVSAYEGNPDNYKDFPLAIEGGIVDKDTYDDHSKEAHDTLQLAKTMHDGSDIFKVNIVLGPKSSSSVSMGGPSDEDIAMTKMLFEPATEYFVSIKDTYDDPEYNELAQDRIDEIETIIRRQNRWKAVRFVANSLVFFLTGVGIANVIGKIGQTVGWALKLSRGAIRAIQIGFGALAAYQGWRAFRGCQKQITRENSDRTEVEEVMEAGEILPNCIAPVLDFLIFTATPIVINAVTKSAFIDPSDPAGENLAKNTGDILDPDGSGSTLRGGSGSHYAGDVKNADDIAGAISKKSDELSTHVDDIVNSKRLSRKQKFTKLKELLKNPSKENLKKILAKGGMSADDIDNTIMKTGYDDDIVRKKVENSISKYDPLSPDYPGRFQIDPESGYVIQKYNGKGSASEDLALVTQWKAEGSRSWLSNAEARANGANQFTRRMSDGNELTWKFHVTASTENYDDIALTIAKRIDELGIPAKVAGGPGINSVEIAGKQYGKLGTVYIESVADADELVKLSKVLADSGLKGIPHEELVRVGSNLQYEVPVPGTNNILYATVEQINGQYIGGGPTAAFPYSYRKVLMNRYKGQGPLDYLIFSKAGVK